MKKILLTAALLGLTATAASATDQNITLNATVDPFCTIGGSLTPSDMTQIIPVGSTGNVVTAPILVTIGDVVCNKASTVTLSSLKGGLFDPGIATAASGFQHRINYIASIAAPVAASVSASAASITQTTGPAVTTSGATSDAAVAVTIAPVGNTSPLMAGTGYTDTLKVSIVPN